MCPSFPSSTYCLYLVIQLILWFATVASVRLVDGGSSNEGRVEVYFNNEWGRVCGDRWDDNDAKVVCRQLGLPAENATAYVNAQLGEGTGNILLDEVQCTGSESALNECRHIGWGRGYCGHNGDTGVVCCKYHKPYNKWY